MHADRVRGAPIFRALLRGLLISHHVQSQFHFQFNLLSTNKTMCLESKILRDLHLTQVIEAAPDAEAGDPRHSILTDCMGDGDKSRKLYFTPAAWLCCLSTSDGVIVTAPNVCLVILCMYLGLVSSVSSTVRSGAARFGAGRSDAVRRVRSEAMRQRVASTNAIQKCLPFNKHVIIFDHFGV